MPVDPVLGNSMYVLCRPQGGLNDCLCQIEYCRKISKKYSRTLIIQTEIGNKNQKNRFHEPFNEIFRFASTSEISSSNSFLEEFNKNLTVNLQALCPISTNLNVSLAEATRGQQSSFKLPKYRKLSHDVEIHETWGGGLASATLLQHIELNENMFKIFQNAYSNFPVNFVGIHFRNTDHKSTFQSLVEQILKIEENEIIITFSDEENFFDLLKQKFPKRNISKSSDYLADINLTLSETKLALVELLILSKAKHVILVPLEKVPTSPQFSGFSRLAKHLWVVNKVKSKQYIHLLKSPQPIKGLAGFKNPLLNLIYLFLYEIPRIIYQSKFPKGINKQI